VVVLSVMANWNSVRRQLPIAFDLDLQVVCIQLAVLKDGFLYAGPQQAAAVLLQHPHGRVRVGEARSAEDGAGAHTLLGHRLSPLPGQPAPWYHHRMQQLKPGAAQHVCSPMTRELRLGRFCCCRSQKRTLARVTCVPLTLAAASGGPAARHSKDADATCSFQPCTKVLRIQQPYTYHLHHKCGSQALANKSV
jgi:hypothetical protein